ERWASGVAKLEASEEALGRVVSSQSFVSSQSSSLNVLGHGEGCSGVDELEELRARLRDSERENSRLREQETSREAAEKELIDQVGPLLARLGHPLSASAGVDESQFRLFDSWFSALGGKPSGGQSNELHKVSLSQVSNVLIEALTGGSHADAARGKAVAGLQGALLPFYKPLKADPVDCMLAAVLLRLDFANAAELHRLAPGSYRFGVSGP
ncbi:unnamed protein product, partial [Polarella glacialis]